jgi:hypothetical protein
MKARRDMVASLIPKLGSRGLFTGLLTQPGVSSVGSKQSQTPMPSFQSQTPFPLHMAGQKKLGREYNLV